MIRKCISLLLCVSMLLMLGGCVLPEEKRFVNPTAPIDWAPTEPPTTQAPETTEPTTPPATQAPETSEPTTPPTIPPSVKSAADLARDLSLEQQVTQLFLVKHPADGAAALLDEHHVGGVILYSQDISGHTPNSLKAELSDYQSRVPVSLIVAVDEEGGIVNRVSSHASFRSERFKSPREIYLEGGVRELYETESEKAQLLKRCGINVNLAPVCDVVTDDDAYMAERALQLTQKDTGKAVAAMVKSMQAEGVGAVLKHFPGFGNLSGDTHTGKVVDTRSITHLRTYDFVPFQHGIAAKAGAVMVGHSIVNCIDPALPASLSADVHQVLRGELGFKGVVMTDDLTMGAVTEYYDAGEAAVQAILAGNDMILTTWSDVQYQAILDAIDDQRITEARILESVTRIIQWKMDLGLL